MAALGLTPDETGLTPDEIRELLGVLDREVGRAMDLDEPLTMLVVGGAAISMQWDPRRYTKDVDVVSQGLPPMLWKVVADVAKSREGVALDWLNAAAQLMVPVPDFDPEPTLVYEGQNIHVYGASARYVLAMKAVSARITDIADLPTLLTAGEFDSFDEVLETVARAHGRTQLPAVTQNKLRQAWDDALTAAATPERGYLSVNPDYDSDWGWQLVARHPDGEPIQRSVTYPTKEAARSVADLAVAILDPGQPLSFVPWAPAVPPPAPAGRGPAVRVSVAHKDEAWQIRGRRRRRLPHRPVPALHVAPRSQRGPGVPRNGQPSMSRRGGRTGPRGPVTRTGPRHLRLCRYQRLPTLRDRTAGAGPPPTRPC